MDVQQDDTTSITTEDARRYMREASITMRNRGHTREHAVRLLAELFGLKVRRAMALTFNGNVRLRGDELARFKVRYEAHLAQEIEELSARTAAARERYRRFKAGER